LAKEQFKSYDSFFFSSGKLRHLKRKRKESEKPKTFIGSWGPLGNSSSYCLAQSGMTELPESHGQDNHFRPQHNIKKLPTHLKETNKKCQIIPGHKYKLGLQKETRYLDSRNEERR
jgi:hypothetical protein